jgi:hypothetical protein
LLHTWPLEQQVLPHTWEKAQHTPPTQVWFDAQSVSPQHCWQVPPQHFCPLEQSPSAQHCRHVPLQHFWPPVQFVASQHCLQVPWQSYFPDGHAQLVPEQTPPVGQVTQVPPQLVCPAGQQMPLVQTCVAAQQVKA